MNNHIAENMLRLIALTTTDELAKVVALNVLEESDTEAKNALVNTCWGEDIDSLRECAEKELMPNSAE